MWWTGGRWPSVMSVSAYLPSSTQNYCQMSDEISQTSLLPLVPSQLNHTNSAALGNDMSLFSTGPVMTQWPHKHSVSGPPPPSPLTPWTGNCLVNIPALVKSEIESEGCSAGARASEVCTNKEDFLVSRSHYAAGNLRLVSEFFIILHWLGLTGLAVAVWISSVSCPVRLCLSR